jgi:small-conductance mechanosensitive channel
MAENTIAIRLIDDTPQAPISQAAPQSEAEMTQSELIERLLEIVDGLNKKVDELTKMLIENKTEHIKAMELTSNLLDVLRTYQNRASDAKPSGN